MQTWSGAIRGLGVGAVLVGLLAGAAGADEPAARLPRYRLQVGQELLYKGSSEFKHQSGKFLDETSLRVWVVAANADGSWRLILRQGSRFTQGEADKNRDQPEQVSFGYCDLHPDGRIVENDSLGFRLSPARTLPRLPKDAAEAKGGWTGAEVRMGETTHYTLKAGADGMSVLLESRRESPMNAIYGFTFKDVYTFDLERGLPVKVESENEQTYGFKGKGQGAVRLEDVTTHEASWCREFAAEAERYFAAQDAYDRAQRGRDRTAAQTKAALEQAKEGLTRARAELKQPELQKQVDELLRGHDRSARYYVEDAERREKVLNKPAAEWETTDIDGKKHALKDYRGKVVVLDFWYRGCGWCIRAMPQMKEVAAHFKDHPVVIFGMNTDGKEEDARFVIEKMGLNYANLKAAGLPEKYQVQGFPTLLIIDQDGVVRDIHVGYSPTLREEVVKSVEGLLKRKT